MDERDLLTPTDPEEFRARVLRRAVQIERRRRRSRVLMIAPAVAAALLLGVVIAQRPSSNATVAAGPPRSVTTQLVPFSDGAPWAVVGGADRNIWVLTRGPGARLTQVTTGGERHTFDLPPQVAPEVLVAGTDQAIWMTDPATSQVLRVADDGTITAWPTDTAPSPSGAWQGGRFWFAEPELDRLTAINRDGDVSHFEVPQGRRPTVVAAAPDGGVWFASSTSEIIGSVTASGAVQELALDDPAARATAMATGPGPALWLVISTPTEHRLAHVDAQAHVVDEPPTPEAPTALSLGPDGSVWYATSSTLELQSPSRLIALELDHPLHADSWALAGDDAMWAVDRANNRLVRLTVH